MTRLLITDVFNPFGVAESAVLSVKRLSTDEAEQAVTSALYGLPDQRREVLAHVYDGVVCDALNSCRSFGVGFRPRAVETAPELRGGDCVLFVTLTPPARFGEFDGFKGVTPTSIAHFGDGANSRALAGRLDRLLAEARASLVFVMLEVECEVETGEARAAGGDHVSEVTHDLPA